MKNFFFLVFVMFSSLLAGNFLIQEKKELKEILQKKEYQKGLNFLLELNEENKLSEEENLWVLYWKVQLLFLNKEGEKILPLWEKNLLEKGFQESDGFLSNYMSYSLYLYNKKIISASSFVLFQYKLLSSDNAAFKRIAFDCIVQTLKGLKKEDLIYLLDGINLLDDLVKYFFSHYQDEDFFSSNLFAFLKVVNNAESSLSKRNDYYGKLKDMAEKKSFYDFFYAIKFIDFLSSLLANKQKFSLLDEEKNFLYEKVNDRRVLIFCLKYLKEILGEKMLLEKQLSVSLELFYLLQEEFFVGDFREWSYFLFLGGEIKTLAKKLKDNKLAPIIDKRIKFYKDEKL